jgi:DNA polymerase-3 subunit gamma/tau
MSEENHTHIALPLKYRPMTFEDVVGQEHVTRTLRHAIESGRIANAYLFVGSRGIGKTTLSRIFAKAINCSTPNGVEPCGECSNCRQIAEGRSLDVTEIDGASHNKVEDIHQIIDAVQFAPTSGKYKIFIVDEVHMLTTAAFNALLKTLEEPPPYVRFIFATTEGDKVLPTIISRCQRFDLRRIQTNQIVERLEYICSQEKIEANRDALLAIARGAEGGMRDALSSLDQLISFRGGSITEEDALNVFGLVSRKALEDLVTAVLTGDAATILHSVETFDSAGKDMRRLAGELMRHFRNLIVYQALGGNATELEATKDQIESLAQQAKLCDSSRIFRIADLLADMEDKLRYVLSVRTLIEMTLLKASRVAKVATIEEVMRAVQALRAGLPSTLPPQQTSVPVVASNAPQTKTVVESSKVSQSIDEDETEDDEEESLQVIEEPKKEEAPPPRRELSMEERRAILDDPKLNDVILKKLPGSTVVDFR